jgi:hypothetical protein
MLKIFASYRNVGADFSSPAAQTRRIYDYATADAATFYLFPTVTNDNLLRTPSLLDRISNENNRNLAITPLLMSFLPHYNNITPYGTATPNRQGITAGLAVGETDKLLRADVIVDLLNEATPIGLGNTEKRSFTGIKGGLLFNLHKAIKFEKAIALSFGIRTEQTELAGVNKIDLQSTLLDAGLTWEVYKGLDILGGYKVLSAKGNEIANQTNAYNQIVGYANIAPALYDYNDLDIQEGIMAFGIRYRFGKNSYFTAQGHFSDFVNNKQKANNYDMSQLFLNYTMVF